MKHVFAGAVHGAEGEDGLVSGGETVVYSGNESSTGETESLYLLQDGRSGGCSDGASIPDTLDPPSRIAVFMAGSQSGQQSSTVAALTSDPVAAAAAGVGGPVQPLAQVLSALFDTLTALLTAEVSQAEKAQHDVEVAKVRGQIDQAKLVAGLFSQP